MSADWSLAEIEIVAEAICLSAPGVNPTNPPRFPQDYSDGEASGYRFQAAAVLLALSRHASRQPGGEG